LKGNFVIWARKFNGKKGNFTHKKGNFIEDLWKHCPGDEYPRNIAPPQRGECPRNIAPLPL
jgi:hypothetical protein